ncbi:MAG: hypothetical protein OEV30_03680 [Ignavibacteria bacterium]|nr:hypothetical protein [Ignavibacteria bacterium]
MNDLKPGILPGLFFSHDSSHMRETLKSMMDEGANSVEKQSAERSPVIRYLNQEMIEISGREATDLLHRISTNDIISAEPGTVVATCFLTEKGRLVDVPVLLIRGPESVLLLPSPGNGSTLLQWIDHFIIMEDLTLKLVSEGFSTFSLPAETRHPLDRFSPSDLPQQNRFLERSDDTIIIRRNVGANDQFMMIVPTGTDNERVLLRQNPITSDSVEARLRRILSGTPSLGKEITSSFNPYEAGLEHLLHGRKGCYVGQEVIARLATYDKVRRKLAGVLMTSFQEVPVEIMIDNKPAGIVTSLSEIPLGGRFPGLAIVSRDTRDGEEISGSAGNADISGNVVALPFPEVQAAATVAPAREGNRPR